MTTRDLAELTCEIENAWSKAIENWQDASSHQYFITTCASANRLDIASKYYRNVRDSDPAKQEEAQRYMAIIITMSTQMLYQQRTPKPGKPIKVWFIAVALSATMVGYSLWLLFR